MLGLALALLAEVVAEGKARLAGGFETGAQRGEAGRYVVLGESEEGGLGGEVRGLDVLGDLVEGLADAGVGGPHRVGSEGYASSWAWWRSSCDQFAGIAWHRRDTVGLFCVALVKAGGADASIWKWSGTGRFCRVCQPYQNLDPRVLELTTFSFYNAEPITLSTPDSSQKNSKRSLSIQKGVVFTILTASQHLCMCWQDG